MESRIVRLAQDSAVNHRLRVSTKRALHRAAERMSGYLVKQIESACRAEKVNCMPIASYSGHNAQIMNQMVPAGMIFLPSVDGISHNPGSSPNGGMSSWAPMCCCGRSCS